MTRIQAGEVTLDYQIHGAPDQDKGRDTIVMIMGLGYAKWGWSWNAPALAQRYKVITFDNRGVGASDAPLGPYTAKMMAQDTAALMDALNIDKAHVIGTSLGGFIAQELALAYPDRVDRLVLACTAAGGPTFVPTPEITVRLLADFPNITSEERFRRSTLNVFTPEFAQTNPDVIEQVIAYRTNSQQGFEQWSWQANAGATFDASDRVHAIVSPTLVVTGMVDNVVDYRNSKLLADAIPNATLLETAGGHLFFVEHADRFNQIASDFIAGRQPEGSPTG